MSVLVLLAGCLASLDVATSFNSNTTSISGVDSSTEGNDGRRTVQVTATGKKVVQRHRSNFSGAAPVLRREPQSAGIESKDIRAMVPRFFPPDVLLQQCDRMKICQCNLEHEIGGLLIGDYHQCNAIGDMVPLSAQKEDEFDRITGAMDSNVNDCDQWKKLVCCSKMHCDESYSLAKQGCEDFKQNLYPDCDFGCSGDMCPSDSMTDPVAYRLQVVTRFLGVRVINMLVLSIAVVIGVVLTKFMPFDKQAPPPLPQPPQPVADAPETESK